MIFNGELKKYKNISGLVVDNLPNKQKILNIIKEKAKIAIVDDEPSDFPLDYLRNTGFNVEVFEEVSLAEFEKFSKYDLVLLDIAGVVEEDRIAGGLELIKRIDGLHVRPLIIAMSSKKFDPKAATFFSIADETMKKPLKDRECEETIIEMLTQKLSPHNVAEKVDAIVAGSTLDNSGAQKVYKILFKYVYNKKTKSEIIALLKKSHPFLDVNYIVDCLEIIKGYVGHV
jgi:CheY-like chemotaxis protein